MTIEDALWGVAGNPEPTDQEVYAFTYGYDMHVYRSFDNTLRGYVDGVHVITAHPYTPSNSEGARREGGLPLFPPFLSYSDTAEGYDV